MDTDYQEIINSFVDTYGLTRGDVIAEIEKTFSSMLSRWHQRDVVALFTTEDKLMATSYYKSSSGTIIQIPIELSTMRGWNTIKRILDKNLSKTSCIREATKLKKKEHQVFWCEIIKIIQNDLIVEIDPEPGLTPLIATCPMNLIGKHELSKITAGQKKAFHLRKVELLQMKDTIRLQVIMDRVSRNLVSGIIYSKLVNGNTRVRCLKRYVGHKAFIESTNFIPKKILQETSREIGEHIQVNIKK